jgi:DNA gyrase subunit A
VARRKSAAVAIDLASFDQPGAHVYDSPLHEEVGTSFLEYAYSVIHSRALPDVRDGLKPVQRRIAYSMHENALRPDRGFVKCGRIVGEVMGKYHPHGDSAIYEALVRLAQDFSCNAPLVDGHGNFGSPDDGPAASRYTEARMSQFTMSMVESIDEDTVDFRLNYSGDEQEPVVLPAAYPNLLVNGSTGIAVGMATNFIPHNLGEVTNAARWLVTHPNATLDKLMEFVPGPDLPTGGMLLGMDQVREAYETGRGQVRMRATAETGSLPGSRGRNAITVTELPYSVGSERVIVAIKKATAEKKLQGVADVKDLTDMNSGGLRLVIECKTGVNPTALLAELYRLTPLETTFGINNVCLVDGQPQTLGLKALLELFLKHRYEVVLRRSTFRRTKRLDRLHLVEGLLKALVDIDKVIKLIRGSENAAAAKDGLIKSFKLSEIQATYILDTPLRRLTKYDAIELTAERDRLQGEIDALSAIIDDEAALKKVVSDELAKVAKDFATERRTVLIDGDLATVIAESKSTAAAVSLEVADDPCQVLVSTTGLVARTAAATEEASQMRARRGRTKHDAIVSEAVSTARGQVLFVTNTGRAFKTNVLDLPSLPNRAGTVSLSGMMPAKEVVALTPGERVVAVCPMGEQAAGSPGLAVGTRNGSVKVVKPDWPVRSDEFSVIGLDAGDEIVGARWLVDGTEALTFVSSDSSLLRFSAAKVRPQGLSGGGMAGIKLAEGAQVVFFGAVSVSDAGDDEAMVVTSTGAGVKVTPFAEYPEKGRATGGVRSMRFLKTRGNGSEDKMVLAWVGPRPGAATSSGDPVDLPAVDRRRDGAGETMFGPDVVGSVIERP